LAKFFLFIIFQQLFDFCAIVFFDFRVIYKINWIVV